MTRVVQRCHRLQCAAICGELAKVKRLQNEAELAAAAYTPADPRDPRKGLSPGNPYTRVTNDAELAKIGTSMAKLEPKDSKFRAAVFKDADGNYIVSYKGTSEGIDWWHNLEQGTIGKSDYYTRAKDIGRSASEEVGQEGVKSVKFVGHSLGGGLASAASHATGQPATTYNAAGLHILNRRWFRADPAIDAVSVKGELLTTIQRNSPAAEAVGTPYELDAAPTKAQPLAQAADYFDKTGSPLAAAAGYVKGAGERALELHGMDSVTAALRKRRRRLKVRAANMGCRC
jgi:hypothetical protein